jgi:hypothetical protein
MPDQRYDAGRQTIGALLSTTSPRIEVPEWQRSYSWTTEEIDAFWQDLIAFDNQYPGQNIVGEEYFLGSIVLVTGGATNLLLDGQQRLATATILLSVLRDARREYKADAAGRLQSKYIADFDDATATTTYVLTLNLYDREFFRSEIQDDPPAVERPAPTLRSHGLIRKAREYFATRVATEAGTLGGGKAAFERNLRIGNVLCDHMSVVAVGSTDEDNAAAVFETLNDRGIGLSTPDLLRNLLLRRAPDAATRERIVAAWRSILAINDEASVEEFLRHYWVSHRGDVRARKLYRVIKDTMDYESMDPLTLSLDLAEAAPLYRDIVRAREEDPELRRLLEGIRALGAKVSYPALLSGYAAAGEDGTDKLRALAAALTTLFVRYNVIGGRETTVQEATVYGMAADLRKTKDFNAAIASLAALAPEAKEFLASFARARVSRGATARYLLREIEHAKRKTQEVAVEGTDRVHVEHIYPQTPDEGAKWPNHAQVIERLGNLTLLGKRLNTSIKNADFPTKKAQGYAGSDILMTQELLGLDHWDTEAIDERQRELSDWAFEIWRFPGEEAPGSEEAAPEGAPQGAVAEEPDQLPEIPA